MPPRKNSDCPRGCPAERRPALRGVFGAAARSPLLAAARKKGGNSLRIAAPGIAKRRYEQGQWSSLPRDRSPMLVTLILVLLTVLASPGLAAAGDLWIPDLCVAQNFGGSGFVVSDFRATSSGCSFQFEDALRGAVSTQVSQWLLGFRLDLSLISKLVETFGAKSKTSE